MSVLLQEATLLRLAERQAGREEELAQARQRAAQAEEQAEDLAQDLTIHQQQVAALKEVRNLTANSVLPCIACLACTMLYGPVGGHFCYTPSLSWLWGVAKWCTHLCPALSFCCVLCLGSVSVHWHNLPKV